ncbi:MAG: methyltransferase [Planctomycetota bacterium]
MAISATAPSITVVSFPASCCSAGSGLGLASAWTLSSHGQGTPLPTATAATLVARGPFAWVRNPMALAGTLQMIAVGWGLGTWPVVILALLGSGVWHFWVRPLEEADLQHRFGASYSDGYRSHPLWIRVRPFLIGAPRHSWPHPPYLPHEAHHPLDWILRLVAAGIFLQTLYFKFTGAPGSVWIFEQLSAEPVAATAPAWRS